ncbi:DUF4147 domain-containing protein [Candidatus Wolfebacteria bacterium]|nr:DUF4147 domain-containing protein [Candidatus Wolfebacteria bacterium]
MIITNFKKLAKTSLRKKTLLVAEAAYEAIDIKKTVKRRIRIRKNILEIDIHLESGVLRLDLNDYKRVFMVGIGKGSALASLTLAEILGKYLTKGIALDVNKPKFEIRNLRLEIFQGTHPLPSKQNIKATKEIIKLVSGLGKDDLLINFICGGGSALACSRGRELSDSVLIIKELTKAGAIISELNTVRKHLSDIKGGGLAKMAYPATVVSLVVSDVYGNDLSVVASGPTVFDKTTKKDAEKILKKYGLKPSKFYLLETPKDKKYFKNVKNILFVCNQDGITGMMEKARKLGLKPKIHSLALEGEAKNILLSMTRRAKKGEAILAAGETTITFDKKIKPGKGGRNQEAVLGIVANRKSRIENMIVISFASDGYDHTESAGAIGDILTVQKAGKIKLDIDEYLKTHSTFKFFQKTGDALYAKKTCFNVADFMLVLKG